MKGHPSVDVVIAARDEERDLPACLDSLERQNYAGPVRVLVAVDRRSQDGTSALAHGRGVAVVGSGRGPSDTRNRALWAGQGSLVAFLDAHCVAEPGWLKALVERQVETGAGGVQGQILQRFTRVDTAPPPGHKMGQQSAYAWLKTGNALYRREVLVEVGGFDPTLCSSEDVDLSWRVLLAGHPLAYCPRAIVTHLDRGSRSRHFQRDFWHGVAAGQLAQRFGLRLLRRPAWKADWPAWFFWLGSQLGKSLYAARLAPYQSSPKSRPWVAWSPVLALRPASGVLWWYSPEGQVLLVDAQRRWGLAAAGELFWRCLTRGWCRERIIGGVARASGNRAARIALDLDEWVEGLVAARWLEARHNSSGE